MIPTPEEERHLAQSRWRRMPAAAQLVFFVLTLVAIAALDRFCKLVHLPEGWVTLLVSVGTAELLILRYRFWRTGVESALWIGGLLAFIFALPSSGKPEAILVVAAAFALAGWRLRTALFGTGAAVLVIAYLAAREWSVAALAASIAVGLIAAVATTSEWKRLSTELLFNLLTIVMPLAGYVAFVIKAKIEGSLIAVFLPLAALLAALGVRCRVRAPLLAAAICIAITMVDAHDLVPLSTEAQLIAAGIIALAIATGLLRALRGRTTGIVVTPVKDPESVEAIQIAAILPMAAPAPGAAESGGPRGDGGEFGGAGASGQY